MFPLYIQAAVPLILST